MVASPPVFAGSTGKTSKLWLFAALGVVLAGGAVLAFVLLRGGGGGSGAASRDALIEDTFTALEAGDGGKLNRLADPGGVWSKVFECKPVDDDHRKKKNDEAAEEFRDPELMAAKAKKLYDRISAGAKGTRIEIVKIVTPEPGKIDDDTDDKDKKKKKRDDDTFTIRKGDDTMPGCEIKQTFRMQTVTVKLKVTEGSRQARSETTTISVAEVGGRYYLQGVPELKLAGVVAKVGESLRDDMCACADKECTEKVERDHKSFAKELKEVPDDARDKLAALDKEYRACRKKAGGKGGGMDDAVAKMSELTDKMCACPDKACADKVMEEMTKWGQEMAKDPDASNTPADADTSKKFADITKRLSDCMTKAMGIGGM